MSKKNTGSYYTPNYLAEFVVSRVITHFKYYQTTLPILEPSVGDGSFIKAIQNFKNIKKSIIELTAVENNSEELSKAKHICTLRNSEFIHKDFLFFSNQKKYMAILGNPPYIKKPRLTKKQIPKCKKIHSKENLSEKSVKNLWASFLVKSTGLLKDNGVLAFVLPSELLQVKFTEEIREFLQQKFQRLEIFTFNDLMFECKGQDTVVLIAYKIHNEKGVFYANIENESQLKTNNFTLKENKVLTTSTVKWNHHLLDSEELVFLEKLKSQLESINYYCDSKPGIVTAANNYFVVDKETEAKYELEPYTSPIIQKGLFVNGSVVFDQKDYQELLEANQPSKILIFKDSDKDTFSEKVNEYLEIGVNKNLPDGYKCSLRENWFVIPNISTEPEGFFFKRCHLYPKILKNSANVFVTDSAYKIEMKESFDINSLIYSFYNSLTLAFAEIEGRYYGGGVLELTPSEFKKLPIPYIKITDKKFEKYRDNFEAKENIEKILKSYDSKILKKPLNLTDDEIGKIQIIRKKLINKRLRKNS